MSLLTPRDVRHVFESLRKGLVPERGIDAFAEGIETERGELHRQLELAQDGEGTIKFLRGGYGCGKTFMARLATLDAQARDFVTSFVVVSDNDLRFHRFDDVYRKVMTELSTKSCPRGALSDILDRWIAKVEDGLAAQGHDDEADDFDEKVRDKLQAELVAHTQGKAPQDFIRVVQTIFELKQSGELTDAGALISWLGGSGNVAAAAKRRAGIKGDITSRDAMDYLRGVLEIVKGAGYEGLLIVIDEAETILRMRKDSRHKSLNGIRQIADAAGSYPGLVWLFTGTKEFFDSRSGVAGLPPLHDRLKFIGSERWVNVRQPQLALSAFDEARLEAVAHRLRSLYPSSHRERIVERISDTFIRRLVEQVTTGLGGDVGVVPRQFLREFVAQLDTVDRYEQYDPMKEYAFEPTDLSAQEEHARRPASGTVPDPDTELIMQEDQW